MSAIAGILKPGRTSPEHIEKLLFTMKGRCPGHLHTLLLPGGALLQGGPEEDREDASARCLFLGEYRYQLAFSGQIYNAAELRRGLEALGHSFRGASQQEVLLHAYAQWGESCLSRLRGIFAFAIWEEKAKRLFLARDPMGAKPLFYTELPRGFLFASEIKALLAHPDVKPRVDTQGIGEIMLLGPGRTPGCGVFQNIRELEPGCCGTWEKGLLQLRRYWQLTDQPFPDTLPQTLERVRALVIDGIESQLPEEGPVCALLSGGLDSSIVCSVAQRYCRARGKKLQTFSLDYLNNERYFTPGKFQPNSDPLYIEQMVKHLGSDHRWIVLETEELVDALDEAVEARDLPGMADVDASLLLFCRKISPYAKTALSGECADEIFGGYPWYRDPELLGASTFPWAQSAPWRARFLATQYREALDAEGFVHERYAKTCLESHTLPHCPPGEKRIKELINLHFRWFMQTLMDRNDRMSAHSGVEIRTPFCDIPIAEYLYRVPWAMKELDGFEKGLLRRAMDDLVPPEILWRKKSPFPKTHDPAYLQAVCQKLRRILEDKNAPLLQIADREALENLLNTQISRPWYGQLMNTPQTVAYMLQVNHWLEHYQVELV